MENIGTIPENSTKKHSIVIYVIIALVLVVIVAGVVYWQYINWSKQKVSVTTSPQTIGDLNYANYLEVPFLKHPALTRTSVLYTLTGFVKKIDNENILLGSSGPDLTLKLSPSTKYGKVDSGKPVQQVTKKDIQVGDAVWVYPEYNPKLRQLDLLWIVQNNTGANEATPSSLIR